MQCPICLNWFPELHQHHLHPIGYGGDPNGQLFSLCSSCHLSVHHTAENAVSKQERKIFLTEEQVQRALPLIKIIINAKLRYKEKSFYDPQRNKKIILKVNEEELRKLHVLKIDKGYKSIEKMILDMLVNVLKNT